MSKVRVGDFDPAVCRGEAEGVIGTCPRLVTGEQDTGRGVVDKLARLENEAVEQVTGEEQHSCGACGCPLVNLEAFDMAPDNCPRLDDHQ